MSESWNKKVPLSTTLLNIFGYLALVPIIILPIYGQYEMAIISSLFLSIVSSALCWRYGSVKLTDLVFLGFFLGSSLLLLFPWWSSIISTFHSAMLWFVLALMAGISLLVKRPFTIEIARQSVSEFVWGTPQFYRINQLITMVFLLVFGTNTVLSILVSNLFIRYLLSFSILGVALASPSIVPKLYMKSEITAAPMPTNVDLSSISVEALLRGMVERFEPSAAEGVKAVLQFKLTGLRSGEFFIDIQNSTATLVQGINKNPELLVEIDSEVWFAIAEGKLDGTQAYMRGQMKVKGDMNLLLMLGQLFPSMNASSENS